jgi:hypothetical protein
MEQPTVSPPLWVSNIFTFGALGGPWVAEESALLQAVIRIGIKFEIPR